MVRKQSGWHEAGVDNPPGLPPAVIDRRRAEAPDQPEHEEKMPPMIGIHDHAFDGLANEHRISGDEIVLPWGRYRHREQAEHQRNRYQRQIRGAAEPAVHQETLHVDVVLLHAEDAIEFERSQSVRVLEYGAQRLLLQPKAAAGPDVVGLDGLGAFHEHVVDGADRHQRCNQHDRENCRQQADDDNARAHARIRRDHKDCQNADRRRDGEMSPGAA